MAASIPATQAADKNRHARIYKTDDGDALIEDLGSHNGTLVNGQAVDMPVGLSPADRIEVGETRGGRVPAEPRVGEDEGGAEAETPRRPWWKRILGGSR